MRSLALHSAEFPGPGPPKPAPYEFDRKRRVKLSPQEWNDTYLSKASCRNLMIDLVENDDRPTVLSSASVRYKIFGE